MKPRQHQFDMLKGLAIFMVVMGHVIAFCIRDIDRTPLFKFIAEVHMPLFIFISGWFTLRLDDGGRWRAPRLWQRARQLLLPMVVVSTLWILYFPHSGLQSPLDSTFAGLWSDTWKNGYWFTPVLFILICAYACCRRLMSRFNGFGAQAAVAAAVWAVIWTAGYLMPDYVMGYTSWQLVERFWPVYVLGILAARHRGGFARITASGNVVTAAMLLGVLCLYFQCWYWEFDFLGEGVVTRLHNIFVPALLHLCLAVVAFALVVPWAARAFDPSRPRPGRWASMWSYMGTKSLGLYLLHYFFLFPLTPLRSVVEGYNLSFVPMLAVTVFWAACITAVTLGFMWLISRSSLLSLLLTGQKQN